MEIVVATLERDKTLSGHYTTRDDFYAMFMHIMSQEKSMVDEMLFFV